MTNVFLPTTKEEILAKGWDVPDIVIVTGDAYVDHPSFGAAIIGRVLEKAGYRVGIIAMPDWRNPDSLNILGAPKLFFAVTSGNIDSMVANYTANKKPRSDDPYVPGSIAGHRPDRALIVYCNAIRQACKGVPIVIGGLEASMRRIPHYDFWSNKVRRSILLDTRADILAYGMAEKQILAIAERFREGRSLENIEGTVIISASQPEGSLLCPSEAEAIASKEKFNELYRIFYRKQDSLLAMPTANRFLVHNPPAHYESIDEYYELPYVRTPHPSYDKPIPAWEMIRDSVVSHRGCVSGCSFCSLSLHQGRRIVSRSRESIIAEVKIIAADKSFRGHIKDIGGPSANMYGFGCRTDWRCSRESCTFPDLCKNLVMDSTAWLDLLDEALRQDGVKHVTVGSGIRYDILMRERDAERKLTRLLEHHVSGQLKIAPEHTDKSITDAMGKTPLYDLEKFVDLFRAINIRLQKKQFLLPYLMINHPGETLESISIMLSKIKKIFGFLPEQTQSFIPLPMTRSAAVYYTGEDPLTGVHYHLEDVPS